MNYKNLTIQELKDLYSDRPGFIPASPVPSSKEGIERLYKTIKEYKLCDYEPDFINELNPTTFAFVYPEGVSFKSGMLYEYSQFVRFKLGNMIQVDILPAFLREINYGILIHKRASG